MGNFASGEADGPTSTWLSRHRPAAGRTRAASVPPSVKTEDLCRETGGADQEWEELDRLMRGEARLAAAGV